MRGNPVVRRRGDARQRSIPAHAGEPCGDRARRLPAVVYPRACGGTSQETTPASPGVGLSPRMRGNHRGRARAVRRLRSIPAHAGEPRRGRSRRRPVRVYPRACGGTSSLSMFAHSIAGLSPRMRGNPLSCCSTTERWGSIPAHAGEPRVRVSVGSVLWVYPRACGGTTISASGSPVTGGLSPRMRGNQGNRADAHRRTGSIPAHAGEPRNGNPHLSRSGVYPRACGGTVDEAGHGAAAQGLSPRMRGNHLSTDGTLVNGGSIPAHAGEP